MSNITLFPAPPARAARTIDDFKGAFAELIDDHAALPFAEMLVAIHDVMAVRAKGVKAHEQLIDDISWATVLWCERYDQSGSDLWTADDPDDAA